MEGGVSPLGQVDLGQDAALARDPWVDLVVGKDHGVDLDALHLVGVITDDPRQLDLPDLRQLLEGEAAGPAAVLVPESVTEPQGAELLGHQAAEGWADHRAGQRLLGDSSRPDVDVLDGGVVLPVAVDGLIVEGSQHLLPALEGLEAAELSPPVVAGQAVLTTALHVEGSQIETELLAGLLEEVVGDLLGDGVVVGLGNLVDHAHDVAVQPAALVQIVRLLQEFVESLRSDVAVGLAPALEGGREQGVSEPKDGLGEDGGGRGVGGRVVAVEVAALQKDELILLHELLAEHHGQELVVGDVLHDGHVDVPGLLEDGLVGPVRVDCGQLVGECVVRADHEGVDAGKSGVLVDSGLTGEEAVNVLSGSDTTFVGLFELERQEGLEPELLENGQHLELAALEAPQLLEGFFGVGVDGVAVDDGGQDVEGGSGSEAAVGSEAVGGPDEVDAPLAELAEESIILRNLDGQAVGVLDAVAALGRLVGLGILGFGRQRDVVIHELAPEDEEDGDGVVVESVVGVNGPGDEPGRGEGRSGDGHPGSAHTVGKVGRQEAQVRDVSLAPQRVVEVVADAGHTSVSLNLALGRLEGGRAVVGDGGLGGVDQRQALRNGVLGQVVLAGQDPAGLLDDQTELS